eukprot:GHVT01085080.1.p1 GENE.GHVT01085080.1~~GHVT01085080.1.p1  ORF type:complete len:224 (+),score=24.73 GHVT01085080.1:1687-2358(+)
MLGAIVGLGDRHGDNILVDTRTGAAMHVDFDCLFGKGFDLPLPEVVPFRLTANLVSPMGPTGVWGTFREACIRTLRPMRTNQETILGILMAFFYDPLLEWRSSEGDGSRQARPQGRALINLADLGDRLRGGVGVPASSGPNRPLDATGRDPLALLQQIYVWGKASKGTRSHTKRIYDLFFRHDVWRTSVEEVTSVEEQVDELIKAAACPYNLAAMYSGWGPWY